MPWSGKSFSKHNKSLDPGEAKHAARQANAILRSGAPEGVAIATANKYAGRRARGGPVKAGKSYLVGEEGKETYEGSPADEREDRAGQAKLSSKVAGSRVRSKLRRGVVSARAASKHFGGKDEQPIDASSR